MGAIIDSICPYCNEEKPCIVNCKPETIMVRQKPITVDSMWLICMQCGIDFDDPKSTFDVLEEAYREYNRQYPDDPIDIKTDVKFE